MALCPWPVEDPLCCPCWNAANPAMKEQAILWASEILHARTGRQFGACEITVRPCGNQPCGNGMVNWFGFNWNGGIWTPYIWNGVWYNCACPGLCSCDPRCQVMLSGPVAEVVEVKIDGVVVDPSAYRVDDYKWLVRQDGECWPECADQNVPAGEVGSFEVTYKRGMPVPLALLQMAAILACEYVKRCTGDDSCRLGSRVVAMSRQGVDFQFVPLDQLLTHGLTGVDEVDQMILAYNPAGLTHRLRVYSSANRFPRQTTWSM